MMTMRRKEGREASLSELAATAQSGGGIECPTCGCRDFRAYRTNRYESTSITFRYKQCRHCGHKVLTSTESRERIVRNIDDANG